MTTQNLWDTAKAVLGGKSIVIQSYLKKQEKYQINNLIPKATTEKRTSKTQSRQKERNHKNQRKINEMERNEIIAKINDTKSWFSEKKQN